MKNVLKSLFREETALYLTEQCPTPRHLLNLTEPEIQSLNLKKPEKTKLQSYLNFAKEVLTPQKDEVIFRSPQDVFNYLQVMQYYLEERFVALYLDVKNKIIDQVLISQGTINSTIVHPREIFSHAVRLQCSGLVVCHPHPSGDPEPSMEDLETTKRLVSAGEILGIKVLDHIIIGAGKFVSFKERGLL